MNRNPEIYGQRFSASDLEAMRAVWRVLCARFFQRWVKTDAAVVDVGAGEGFFLEAIAAGRKTGIDMRPRPAGMTPDILWEAGSWRLLDAGKERFDVVFTSNFIEHLADRDELMEFAESVRNVLKPGGRWLLLGPNIRYARERYWDFVDHRIALTDRSAVELARLAGFRIETCIPRFLPFTGKSRMPRHPRLVDLYLACPPVWRIWGAQFFIAGSKPEAPAT